MFDKEELRSIIVDQAEQHKLPKGYVHRELEGEILGSTSTEIRIITGVRRVGKSSMLQAVRQELGGEYYMNFDDERLIDFTVKDFQKLLEVFLELYGDQDRFYFDEIQNVPGWERFVRRLYDMNKEIFITGSNASLLSRELGTHLTGRYIPFTLYPFSFREFLKYKKIRVNLDRLGTKSKVKLLKALKEFLEVGGIPRYVIERDETYLRVLYESVLFRDLIVRFDITEVKALRTLAKYLMSNYARLVSLRQLKSVTHLKSISTIANYLEYLQDAYLFTLVPKYSYSLKDAANAPRKVYAIDLGLANVIGFNFSQNTGHKLENAVLLELKRRNQGEVYYYRNGESECDFLIQRGTQIMQAIQVTASITSKNQERELDGLVNAMDKFNVPTGVVISLEQRAEIEHKGRTIQVFPIYEWLLDGYAYD